MQEDWLRQLPALPNGIPSRDCIRRVLSALKPEAFQTCFQSWMASPVSEDEEIRPTIAIDGKTMRRSHDRSRGLGPLHPVSAWASERGLALGQVATEERSNEITAIPEPIDRMDVKNVGGLTPPRVQAPAKPRCGCAGKGATVIAGLG